jgi:hypothetical protein
MCNVHEETRAMRLPVAATRRQQHSRRIMAAIAECWTTVWVCYLCYVSHVNFLTV